MKSKRSRKKRKRRRSTSRVSKKISKLMDEGYSHKQAVAIALRMRDKNQIGSRGGYVKRKKSSRRRSRRRSSRRRSRRRSSRRRSKRRSSRRRSKRRSSRRRSKRRSSRRRPLRGLKASRRLRGGQKCSADKILNPKTGRCVKKSGNIGRKISSNIPRRKAKSLKKKECPAGKIRNPKTGRCVSTTSRVGRKILLEQPPTPAAVDITNAISSIKNDLTAAASTAALMITPALNIEKYFTTENCQKYCAQPENVDLTDGQKRYLEAIKGIEDRIGDAGYDDDVIEWSDLDLEEDVPTDDEEDLLFMESEEVVQVPVSRSRSPNVRRSRGQSPKKPRRRAILQQVSRPEGGNMFI